MKHIILRKNGGPEVLKLEELSTTPEPSAEEVVIDVHYSGINFADVVMRLGLYPDAPPKPFVPGYEVSGIVRKVGSAVTGIKAGDQVVAGSIFGGYASVIKTHQDLVFSMPSHLSLAEACALPVNWITAHCAVMDMGRVRLGDRVMVDCASGGVGSIALQILKNQGADTVGLTGSPNKMDFIRSLGATAMSHEDFQQNDKHQYDLVLNSQGGSSVRQHYNRLTATGRVVAFGMSSGIKNGKRDLLALAKLMATMPRFSLLSMFDKNRGVYALNALRLLEDQIYRKSLQEKWKTVEKIGLKPHVHQIFKAEDVAKAHRLLESRGVTGKVLLSWVGEQ